MFAMSIYAQELSEQELQAKEDSVFSIKFKEQAHYAETVIDMITEDDAKVSAARQQSMLLLQTHIIEIFSKYFKMTNQDVREIWDVIEDKCQNVEVKRGTLWRVFTYMAKDAFKGLIGGKVKDLSEEDMEILFGPIIPDPLPPLPEPDPYIPVDTITRDSIRIISPTPLQVHIPELCKKMMDKENVTALKKYLSVCAFYHELFYGNLHEMQTISNCYVVIIEKASQKIKAILDKGDSARLNFMTKKMDYYGNYDNTLYEMIFVQEL